MSDIINIVIQPLVNQKPIEISMTSQNPIEIAMTKPGPKGIQGDTGSQGTQGIKGDTGDTGVQGLQGNIGLTGNQGIQGLKGDIGLTGSKGDKGDDGYTPIKGTDYFDGAKGDKGDTGLTGTDGYTPIKGTDYFDGDKGDTGIQGVDGVTISVNDITQVSGNVSLTPDNFTDGITNKVYTATEKTKLADISGSNTGDQNLSSYALDSGLVHLAGAETITGSKTFTNVHNFFTSAGNTVLWAKTTGGATYSSLAVGNPTKSWLFGITPSGSFAFTEMGVAGQMSIAPGGATTFSSTVTASNLSGTNTGDQDITSLVPYTGATANVDLGVRDFSAANVNITGGIASAPSYSFTGDLDTGMFQSAGNTLNFATAGLERLKITTTAVIFRIKMAIPSGTALAPGMQFDNESSTGIYRPGAGALGFSVLGSLVANLTATGLGLGETNPSEKLDVDGNIKATGYKSGIETGQTATATNVVDIRDNAGTLEKKTQVLIYTNGLLTTVGAVSAWT